VGNIELSSRHARQIGGAILQIALN